VGGILGDSEASQRVSLLPEGRKEVTVERVALSSDQRPDLLTDPELNLLRERLTKIILSPLLDATTAVGEERGSGKLLEEIAEDSSARSFVAKGVFEGIELVDGWIADD